MDRSTPALQEVAEKNCRACSYHTDCAEDERFRNLHFFFKGMPKKILIEPPKGQSAFTIPTDDFLKLHTLCLVSGRRGGGKSVAIANLLRVAMERGYFDRCLVITPTYGSNRRIWDMCGVKEADALPPTKDAIRKVTQMIEEEKNAHDEYVHIKKKYQEYQQRISKRVLSQSDVRALNHHAAAYDSMGFFDRPPVWRYKDDSHPARIALVIDDCVGTPVYLPSGGLTAFCVAHRHHAQIGCSVFMLVQSYCAKEAVNRAIRENTCVLLLFKCVQESQLKKIYEESDLPVSYEAFLKMCLDCHKEKYGFLTMDFSADDPQHRFRKNFGEFLPYIEQELVSINSLKH